MSRLVLGLGCTSWTVGRGGHTGSSVDVVTVLIQHSELSRQVATVAELDEVLNRLAVHARPTLVELRSGAGVLVLGVGRADVAVVLFRDEGGAGWWGQCRNDSSLDAFEDLMFAKKGSMHRFFDRAAVRPSQMREAAREFVRAPGARPAILDCLPRDQTRTWLRETTMDPEFETAAIAIYTGQLEDLVSELTANPGLVTRRSTCGHPTLLQLVACDHVDIVDPVGAARVLVDRGAETWPEVVSAAGCNSTAVLQFLIDSGADYDKKDTWAPLEEALYWASQDTLELLVEQKAAIRSLAAAAGLGDLEAMDSFLDGDPLGAGAGPIRSPFPDTVPDELANAPSAIVDHAFVMAVNSGQLDAAERLHVAGARVNNRPPGYHWNGTALHAACWRGNSTLVSWLMSIGADPAIRDGLADADAAGWANHHGHPELVPLLDA